MKNIVFVFLLFLSVSLFGQANIGGDGALHPTGSFPVALTSEIKGSTKQVADLTVRDAIATNLRTEGMQVYVVSTQSNYMLVGGIGNGSWVLIPRIGVLIQSDTPNIAYKARNMALRYISPKADINYFDSGGGTDPTPYLTRSNDYLNSFGRGNVNNLKNSYHTTAFGNGNAAAADSIVTSQFFGTQLFQRAQQIIACVGVGTDNFSAGLGILNYNIGIGFHNFSNFFSTIGNLDYNIAIGSDIGLNSQTVTNSTIIGYRAGSLLRNVINSVYIGNYAGYYQYSGNFNTYVGFDASNSLSQSQADTSAAERAAFGYRSLFNRKGSYLSAYGVQAGMGNTITFSTSSNSTYLGNYTNFGGGGNSSTYVGSSAGYWGNGDGNTVVGASAAFNTSVKNYNNSTLVGYNVANSYSNAAWLSEDLTNRVIIGNSNATNQPFDANTTTKRVKLNEFINLTPRATTPSSPERGDIFFDSTVNKIKFYNGTAWEIITSL